MSRLARAVGLGLFLTLGLAAIAKHAIRPVATLTTMMDRTVRQPFVRRQFVPFTLLAVDSLVPSSWKVATDNSLASNKFLQPFLFCNGPSERWDSLLCLLLWLCCFTIFAYTLESEAHYYTLQLEGAGNPSVQHSRFSIFTFVGCLLVVLLKGASHLDFVDDPLFSPLQTLSHGGAIPARRVDSIVRTYVLAFLDETLRNLDPQILRSNPSPFPEVSFRAWPADEKRIPSSTVAWN